MLSLAVIVIGYVSLVAMFGLPGALAVALHLLLLGVSLHGLPGAKKSGKPVDCAHNTEHQRPSGVSHVVAVRGRKPSRHQRS